MLQINLRVLFTVGSLVSSYSPKKWALAISGCKCVGVVNRRWMNGWMIADGRMDDRLIR